jgi:hypothetical protein
MLIRFLRLSIHRHRFLKHLIREILQFDAHLDSDDFFISESVSARNILDLQEIDWHQANTAYIIMSKLVHTRITGTKRTNAELGLFLGEYLQGKALLDLTKSLKISWMPVLQGNPSTIERIAAACLTDNPTPDTYSNSSPEVKVLIGFIFSKRKLYTLAREVLEEAMFEVEISSGSTSLEYGLVAAELITCCNITQEEARG